MQHRSLFEGHFEMLEASAAVVCVHTILHDDGAGAFNWSAEAM
jgi:hypothetical protein